MRIRDARDGDAGAIGALERQCFADPWPEEAVAAYINGGNCLMLCAEGRQRPLSLVIYYATGKLV